MRVVLAFPFRDDDSGSRRKPYDTTRAVVSKMYDFYRVLEVDSNHVPFNRAATRNVAVSQSESYGADVVVLCDADSIPEERALREAIAEAESSERIHYPFSEVWELAPKAIHRIGTSTLAQLRHRAINRGGRSEGGIWVCRPDVWWRAGGQDERLAKWGCEDRAFLAANHTLVGQPIFHEGVLLCLWHDRPSKEDIWFPPDVDILIQHENAYKNPEKMREVISGRPNNSHPKLWTAQECRSDV